ncbi:pilus assembly protein TadG-related protein [Mesorhizobium sp. M0091]|uniref:TadE/TadG family type IV pilus assembly protein n=1 Tax=Mesorhizobium sp. M0091 TaxID=2956875 RepID=UPI0033369D94
MLRTVRAFWHDQKGLALILVSVMLPAIIGFSLLAIDMSRVNNLHNDLQKGADAFALAAAAELDGSSGSWVRAERAMATLVHNESNFSTAGRVPMGAGQPGGTQRCNSAGSISWCFLKAIPPSDGTKITTANQGSYLADSTPAVGEKETRFIQVTVVPEGFAAIFPASFVTSGASDSFNVGAVAVAGFTSGVCDFTPVFMCNPYEMANGINNAGGYTLEQAVSNPAVHRRLIELRKVGNGAAAGPGNFGFLEPPQGIGNGAQALAETIATSTPIGCYNSASVSTKTGQNAGPVQDAFNVRFGIKASGNNFNTPVYGPAANVRKGAIKTQGSANQCPSMNQLSFTLAGTMGLPRDATTPYLSGRMGDGNWNFSGYWSTNFHSAAYPASWDTTKPTRYEVYRYEISAGLVSSASTGGEVGTPSAACQPPVTTIDRRLIYGAILNCNALEAAGNDLSGHSTNLPVEAFGSFFLTEPVPSASDDASVMVELVDVTGGAGQGTLANFLRDEAQLYR